MAASSLPNDRKRLSVSAGMYEGFSTRNLQTTESAASSLDVLVARTECTGTSRGTFAS